MRWKGRRQEAQIRPIRTGRLSRRRTRPQLRPPNSQLRRVVGGIDGDPPMALTITGSLAEGTDLLHDRVSAGEDDEAFYLSFEEDRGSGFFLHSKAFRGARWAGPILEITVGGVVLRVEPESGS
jgi:hypothetical protein